LQAAEIIMPQVLLNQLQHALTDIFNDTPLVSLEQNVDRALEIITKQLPCDGVFVLNANLQLNRVKARNLYLKPQFNPGQLSHEWPLMQLPFFRSLIRQAKTVNIEDIQQLPHEARAEKNLLRQWHVKSLLILPPVTFGETRIAVGAVSCDHQCRWEDGFINELSHAAALIGSAMELTRIAQALLASERRYQELFNQLPLSCGLVSANNTLSMLNRIALQNLAVANGSNLLSLVQEQDTKVLLDTLKVVRDGVLGQAWCELAMKGHGRQHQWLKLNFSQTNDGSETLVMTAEDVSERHRLAGELSFHANYDALTGLPNRLHFEAMLGNMLGGNSTVPACVGFLDLDRFQVVNNLSGHRAGDQLLCQVAQRLKQLVRKGDLVARLGGDEFGILMHYSNADSAKMIAKRICGQLGEQEFDWQGCRHNVSASMGIAELDLQDSDIYTVMSQADAACRLAKQEGRNRWHLYSNKDPKMHRLYHEMTASIDILGALALDKFELYFQPIAPLTAGDPQQAPGLRLEILLRLLDNQGEPVPPAIFLAAAERYNLATRVDRYVVDALLKWGGDHPALWQELDSVSVNLSATSLADSEFIDWLEVRLLSEPDLAGKLCFEITETAALDQLDKAARLIEILRFLGCKLALDDFGAGFSSFAYLKKLNVDLVKIDGQFVANLCEDDADQAIITAICLLGRQLNFQVVAECVESQAIGEKLQALGVDYAQGFAIARPASLSELTSGQASSWLVPRPDKYPNLLLE
jgi:diguanylate cyclase (GGDEF)-like protein